MSKSKTDNAKTRTKKPLLPLEDDGLVFDTQPHTPISLEEIGKAEAETKETAPEKDLSELPPAAELEEEEELLFTEQPHTPISLEEISMAETKSEDIAPGKDLSELPPAAEFADDEEELLFTEQPHTPILLDDLQQTGIVGTLPRHCPETGQLLPGQTVLLHGDDYDDDILELAVAETETCTGEILPRLQHMDDDELPFIEQPHMDISLDDLEEISIISTHAQAEQSNTPPADDGDSTSAAAQEPLPELQAMDDDELPFEQQPHMAISLSELEELSAPPAAAASAKAAKPARAAAKTPDRTAAKTPARKPPAGTTKSSTVKSTTAKSGSGKTSAPATKRTSSTKR